MRGNITQILTIEFKDYTIISSAEYLEALLKVTQYQPDILLVDIDEHHNESFQFIDYIKSNTGLAEIPILAITTKHTLAMAYKAGATDHIKKPIDKTELLVRVKSTLAMFKLLNGIIKQSEVLEKQSQELARQKEEIENEKKKSDLLLLNILPQEVADQLKNKGTVQAKHYKIVSVMFSDFKGFTTIAESLSSDEVVRELSICFEHFDEIIERHYIEKIKTIGDSYMCAGGLPIRNKSNPIDVTLAGLEILDFMEKYNTEKIKAGKLPWELRLGIHTGEVVAGVIGKKKFAYDIWGDTVNTASRMESSGSTGKLNISEDTYQFIKEYFDCTYRGKIMAKNKGEIAMYYVDGIKPELSTDTSHITPNERFKEILSYF